MPVNTQIPGTEGTTSTYDDDPTLQERVQTERDIALAREAVRMQQTGAQVAHGVEAAQTGDIPGYFAPAAWAGYGMQSWQDLTQEQLATLEAQRGETLGRVGGFLEGLEAPQISAEQRAQMLGLFDPYMQAGQQGLAAMGQGISGYQGLLADPSAVLRDPGVMAQMRAGQQAVETSQAAGGMQLSGATLASLQQRGQDIGRQSIDAALARQQGLAGLGGQQAGMGLSAAGQAGGLLSGMDIANMQAQGSFQELGMRGQGMLAGLEQGFMETGMGIETGGLESMIDIYGSATQGITGANLADRSARQQRRAAERAQQQQMMMTLAAAMICSEDWKENKSTIDHMDTLDKVDSLRVEKWTYNEKAPVLDTNEHIGPYAEEFNQLFGTSGGDSINIVDAFGVCLSAVKGLSARVKELENANGKV